MPQPQLPYEPTVIVETPGLPREEWLAYRRTGIGGSEAAAIMGISPFATARDVYYDKKQIVPAFDEEANKYQKKIGTLLEDVVAEMFAEQTGYTVFKVPKMYRSREHPCMICDVDYFVLLPDGSIAILECKTTAPDATGHWWDGPRKVVPPYYEAQGRHYMSVMHINKVFFACLHGNSEQYLIIREIDRDIAYEAELVWLEEHFWNGCFLADVPPPYTESGDLILQSAKRHHGAADPSLPVLTLESGAAGSLARFMELQRAKAGVDEQSNALKAQMQRLQALVVDEMGQGTAAQCEIGGQAYTVTYNPVLKSGIEKKNLLRLQMQLPDVYKEYVTVSESRRFYVRPAKQEAA